MEETKDQIKIIECPRDAMQGIQKFIPTDLKVKYLNQLLRCNFDTIDFGSFVSHQAIPQLKDTSEVLNKLDLDDSTSKLLVIVANKRGAEAACSFEPIDYLGFPFSISHTFLRRNINSSFEQALLRLDTIRNKCEKAKKELVVYISMAFGNPYGEKWDPDIVLEWSHKLHKDFDVNIISLADTIGTSTPDDIKYLFSNLIPELTEVEFGAHLHTSPDNWKEKVLAVWEGGCRRIDGAIRGFGGCPMAKDELVGNMPTENLIQFIEEKEVSHTIDKKEFEKAVQIALDIFP